MTVARRRAHLQYQYVLVRITEPGSGNTKFLVSMDAQLPLVD